MLTRGWNVGLAWLLPAVASGALMGGVGMWAQEAAPASAVVPTLVRFAGELASRPVTNPAANEAERVALRFAIYAESHGGTALWSEEQSVSVDKDGNYAVLLGAGSSTGLPLSVFATGEARWIGVRMGDEDEQPRVLLTSVPYAMKAADANSLAGRAASEFVTQDQLNAQLNAQLNTQLRAQLGSQVYSAAAAATPLATTPTAVTGAGTAKYLPLWTAGSTLGNSALYQSGTATAPTVGINTTSPATTLDVNGQTTLRNELILASAAATSSAAVNSPSVEWVSNAWNSSTAASVSQKFVFRVTAAGNNTTAPTGSLDLQTASGSMTPASTGLTISPKGIITFASGQTFPGAGTGTGSGTTIKAGTGLTSSTAGSTQTLAVDATKVPLLAAATNNFAGMLAATGGVNTTQYWLGGQLFEYGSSYNGSNDVFLGFAGNGSQGGDYDTAVGPQSMYDLTSGDNDTAVGSGSMARTTTGGLNTGLGADALYYNVTGSNNTGVGVTAGPDSGSPNLQNSTAIGANATVSENNALVLGQTKAGSPGASYVSVGIGTAVPASALEVAVSAAGALGPTLTLTNPGGDLGSASVDFKTYLHTSTLHAPTSRIIATDDNNYGNFMYFQSKTPGSDSNGLQTNMEIADTGEVAIGLAPSNFNPKYYGSKLVVQSSSADTIAGYFAGDVVITGSMQAAVKSFRVEDPLDPENKMLVHESVESSELMNIYSGNVTTDAMGLATVKLPAWFEAENADFRYQLTTIGRDAHAWIADEVSHGQFKIATNATFVKVSWQITAVRQDSYAKTHPVIVEQPKLESEKRAAAALKGQAPPDQH